MTGQYGLHDMCLRTPCVIGKSGVEHVLEMDLDELEQKALKHSADTLRSAYGGPSTQADSGSGHI
jgi:malate/lactate dehydrogenase